MGDLAEKINHFLNEVILTAENQHEILVGSCTSDVRLTNTQEHILMLLSQESLTNSDLAKRLNVSQAAVTKAVKALVEQKMLETFKDKKDARVTFYRLTDLARPIAEEHQHHHVHTLDTYQRLTEQFSSDEQEVIMRFLDGLIGEIGK
ncbi:zinc-dependent MarR family transcriptional regulator [Streptococcus cristatus]|uniref:zinc-dependent MarR family transcriptional regulator n=1 Tax=Streptococcus cristatus TaxID=45634 RepID=UPI0011E73BA3|nr:zinc-dependent MarR family transcriptional regulator [Streptococcus cristatus]